MIDIIRDFNKNHGYGLKVVDLGTGFGKTTAIRKYIEEMYLEYPEANRKRVVFISPLLKNLKDMARDLNEDFSKAAISPKIVFLENVIVETISAFTTDYGNTNNNYVPDEIKKISAFNNLQRLCNAAKTTKDKEIKNAIKKQIESMRKDFLGEVSNKFKKTYPKTEDRKRAINEDKEWRWIKHFFPEAQLFDADVILLTPAKFYFPLTSPVDYIGQLYNSTIINDSIIFFDESDQCKIALKNSILNNVPDARINLIDLIKHIGLGASNNMDSITIPSNANKDKGITQRVFQNRIDGIHKDIREFYDEYHLDFPLKTDSDLEENEHNFLFHDFEQTSYYDKPININWDGHQNRLTAENKGNQKLDHMLARMNGFVNKSFRTVVEMLARNYMNHKHDQGDMVYSYDQSLRTILRHFDLSHNETDYLIANVFMQYTNELGRDDSFFDFSFYENGFRYFNLSNSPEHDTKTDIDMLSCSITPEKILVNLAMKAKVFLISATSTIATGLTNFNLLYVKERLGENYQELTDDEYQRLTKEANRIFNYETVNINCNMVPDKIRVDQIISDYGVKRSFEMLLPRSENDPNNYCQSRYLRIMYLFKEFWGHDDIRSFLCLMNKLPKNGDQRLDRNVVLKMVKEFFKSENIIANPDDHLFVLDSEAEGFEKNKDELLARLGKGNKIFVLSTYATVGTGQNLQYPIPEDVKKELIKVNDRGTNDYKDFDAVYVDCPTNILTKKDADNYSLETDLNIIYETEELRSMGELSASKKKIRIKGNDYKKYSDFESVRQSAWAIVAQGIGRTSRTNMKPANIYIYLHDEITKYVPGLMGKYIYSPEVDAAYNTLVNNAYKNESEKSEITEIANMKCISSKQYIDSLKKRDKDGIFKESNIAFWKELREQVLVHPTISAEEYDKLPYRLKNAYFLHPTKGTSYDYGFSGDYEDVKINFKEDENCLMPRHIDSEEVGLTSLMKIPGIKEWFCSKGYSTEWKPNEYILTPVMVNNIYKGALGETAGEYLLRTIGINLSNIIEPDRYELFDFETNGKYIDFKFWKDTNQVDEELIIPGVIEKARKCCTTDVFVVNILTKKEFKITLNVVDGIRIHQIPYLYMISENKLFANNEAFEYLRENI